MKVADVMRCTLMTVSKTQSVYTLANWYNNLTNNSRVTYVVDDSRKLLGIVTIYDLIKSLSTPWFNVEDKGESLEKEELSVLVTNHLNEMKQAPVETIMRNDYQWVGPDEFFPKTIHRIIADRHTAIPVLDHQGNLLGEISRRIVLSVLGNPLDSVSPCGQRPMETPMFNFQGMLS